MAGIGLFCDYRFIHHIFIFVKLDCRQINALNYFKNKRRWKNRLINWQLMSALSGLTVYNYSFLNTLLSNNRKNLSNVVLTTCGLYNFRKSQYLRI